MGRDFKALEGIAKPDVTAFVIIDPKAPGLVRPVALADNHAAASALELPNSVPEHIRQYFDAARMLWVYGWFFYPFYSMAALHAGLVVEMALAERFRTEGIKLSDRDSTLQRMLDGAVERGWFAPERFSNIQRRLERERDWRESLSAFQELDAEFYLPPLPSITEQRAELFNTMKHHLDTLRRLRNHRAHPKALAVTLPGMTLSEIEYVRDVLIQLFSPQGTAQG